MSIRLFCAASLIACSAITLLAVEPSTLAAAPNPQPFDHPLVFEPNHGQAPAQVQWIECSTRSGVRSSPAFELNARLGGSNTRHHLNPNVWQQ